MSKNIRQNRERLPFLDEQTMTAIFDCVYDLGDDLKKETKTLLADDYFLSFIQMLKGIQEFNYRHRQDRVFELYSIFERSVGPMQSNSDGTILWFAMGLAAKETYGMSNETLERLLKQVKLKK